MKIVLYILGVLALAAIVFLLVMMYKTKKTASEVISGITGTGSTGGTGYSGVATVPTGSIISLGGTSTIVAITELTQKLLSGMSFSDDPKILDGTVQIKVDNNRDLNSMAVGQFFVWDKTFPLGIIKDQSDGDKNPDQLIQGIKRKNLIWQLTNEQVNYTLLANQNDPSLGSAYKRLRCSFYFIDGTEKVFPIPSQLTDDYLASWSQWKRINKQVTQTNLNTYNSTH